MSWVPKVLCVDDEPNVLHGLRRSLRGRFEVFTAGSGEEALRMLQSLDVAVICSDMRMPGMDGAAFLARAAEVAPDATRVLLSGQSDLTSVVQVINACGVHRFLMKPCERADLLRGIGEAAERHRLLRAERELLEGTVVGSLATITQVLEGALPVAATLGRRVRRLVERLAELQGQTLGWEERTATAVAAVGLVQLERDVLAKMDAGRPLEDSEASQVAAAPGYAASMLRPIPRLEPVVALLDAAQRDDPGAPWVSRALRVVMAFLGRDVGAVTERSALQQLGRGLDPELVSCLWGLMTGDVRQVVELSAREIDVGMEIIDPIYTRKGVLLMPAGLHIDEAVLAKLRNFSLRYGLREPLRARLPLAAEDDLRAAG